MCVRPDSNRRYLASEGSWAARRRTPRLRPLIRGSFGALRELPACLWRGRSEAAFFVGLALVARLAQDPEVVWLPRTSAGYGNDVVHLKALVGSALLAGETVPGEDPSPSFRPVARPRRISSTCLIPALPELMFPAAAVSNGRSQAALVQADALGSGHAPP